MRRGARLLLGAFGLACAAARPVTLEAGPRDYVASDYRRVYERWTRDAEAYAWTELEDVLRVTATFEAWDFRWAYVVRYAQDHSLLPDQREALLQATLSDAGANHRFFLTLAGQYYREGNLAARSTARRVLLVDPEGGQTAPYVFVGPARYVSHRGERPIAFEWELEADIPADRVARFSL